MIGRQNIDETLTREEALWKMWSIRSQHFEAGKVLKDKVKELNDIDASLKDNEIDHSTERKPERRRLHVEKSIIRNTKLWVNIQQAAEATRERLQEEAVVIKDMDNHAFELQDQLTTAQRLARDYEGLYEAKCKEVNVWQTRLSQVLDRILCELCIEEKDAVYEEGTREEIFCWNRPIVI